MNLFVYGELCRGEVLRRLLGRLPTAEPAVLFDHVRRRSPTTGYFEVTPAAGGQVAGLLLDGLGSAELDRLDEFEGVASTAYRRQGVRVRLLEREIDLQADVYLAASAAPDARRPGSAGSR